MKNLKTFEGFISKPEIEIYPDDNSNSTFKISIDEYEELADLGILDKSDNTYDSDKYYDIISILGKVKSE